MNKNNKNRKASAKYEIPPFYCSTIGYFKQTIDSYFVFFLQNIKTSMFHTPSTNLAL